MNKKKKSKRKSNKRYSSGLTQLIKLIQSIRDEEESNTCNNISEETW